MGRLALVLGASLACAASLAAPARADAIPADYEEPDCPPGSGASAHDGVCVVNECSPGATCDEDSECRPVKLCVSSGTVGRMQSKVLIARSKCSRDADCSGGATCRSIRGCVDAGGLCNAGGPVSARHGAVALGAGVLLILAALARRRHDGKH